MRDDNELPMTGPADDGSDDLLIRRAARELQAPVAFGADFDARVMAAVRAAAADEAVERKHAAPAVAPALAPALAPAFAPHRAWAWVVRPRTLRVSPLAGLAVAAGLAFVMVGVARQPDGAVIAAAPPVAPSPTAPVVPVPAGLQQVQFVLVAPSAKSVALVGDFNDWSATATPLVPVRAGGMWTITVPLQPGRYTYNFVVDGSRVLLDPAAPAAPTDDFGTAASIVTVAGAQS
jgi:hypothetical protein